MLEIFFLICYIEIVVVKLKKKGKKVKGTDQALSKSHIRVWLKMLRLCSEVKGVIRERLKSDFDTTLPRFDVMAALYRYQQGLKMSEVSGVLRVSNGNITGIVDRLEIDGLVERIPVENDRRAMVVKLTQQGLEEFERRAKRHEEWIDDMFVGLNHESSVALIEQLNSILEQVSNLSHKKEGET